jgi:GNAT superfamily N-acetyltransferase
VQVAARKADSRDSRFIRALLDGAKEQVVHQRGGKLLLSSLGAGPPTAEPAAGQATPRNILVVGTIEAVIVGAIAAVVVDAPGGGRLCRLDVVYVEPEAREVGVGTEMLALVSDLAAAAGAEGLDVPVLPGQRETKNFFESEGFVARLIVMHRR